MKLGAPPKFTGTPDSLANLLFFCDLEFQVKAITYDTDSRKIIYLTSFLTGSAFTWARTMFKTKDPCLTSYDAFVTKLNGLHGDADEYSAADAEARLEKLRQTGSCTEYAASFDQYTAILGFNDASKATLFKRGLKPNVKTALAGLNQAFADYMGLREAAIRIDQQLFAIRSDHGSRSGNPGNSAGFQSSSPTKNNKKKDKKKSSSDKSSSGTSPRGRLTPEEREHRKKNNLCLYCGKSGHAVATCPDAPKKPGTVNATLPSNALPPSVAVVGTSQLTMHSENSNGRTHAL